MVIMKVMIFSETWEVLVLNLNFFNQLAIYNTKGQYKEVRKSKNTIPISGNKVRQSIIDKERLPDWFVRDDVQDILFSELKSGNNIF